jgi:hypothetical protein
MAKVNHVKSARKDYPEAGIKKGESYYWWEFRFGGTHRSKTPPKPSQLTQSEFLSTLYSAKERMEAIDTSNYETVSDLESEIEEIRSDLEQLKDDTQEKLDNMPEGLQQGDTGQLLQERIDNLDGLISELEGIDFQEPDSEEDTKENNQKEEGETDEAYAERIEQLMRDQLLERLQEIVDEANNASWDF